MFKATFNQLNWPMSKKKADPNQLNVIRDTKQKRNDKATYLTKRN